MKRVIYKHAMAEIRRSRVVLLLMAFFALSQSIYAQEEIRSIVVDEHDSVWYVEQELAWERVLSVRPQDEHVWRNLFEAVYYQDMLRQQRRTDKARHWQVVERMYEAIPDSYTYNICMCRCLMGDDVVAVYADAALRLLPDDVRAEDCETLLGYLWMTGVADAVDTDDHARFELLLQHLYETQRYPSSVLRYCYNQFQGMEDGSLYIANGDVALFPAVLLQEVLQSHCDKVIVVVPFLSQKTYTDNLCHKLGIAPFEVEKTYADWKDYSRDVLDYIVHETKRTAYFFPGAWHDFEGIEGNLYSEGLLLRYSAKKYDNLSRTIEILEKKYHLDYLTEPAFVKEENWTGGLSLQLNYSVMLSHVITAYQQAGNKDKAQRLARILRSSIMNTPLPEDTQRKYLSIVDKAMR
ncbi:MAG: hypothetical protein NC038_06860 [Paludibacter sp.]|nr:hypothetical protein [Bacteroidales bacterium]MCM1069621.1 hypothetical protein [Prevotella sp.]MCM1354267.1 hypothetical protein [Bacteroides sp.]MCM1443106.1 hypothetical protein [Muribaculum sp.]MCM1482341.1 hypothetical protein [Paludibacter sp.]